MGTLVRINMLDFCFFSHHSLQIHNSRRVWRALAGPLLVAPLIGSCDPGVDPDASEVVALSAGSSHNCAVVASGALRCWGSGQFGIRGGGEVAGCLEDDVEKVYMCELGSACCVGDDEPASESAAVEFSAPVVQVSAGSFHTCAVLEGGAVRCWGAESSGKLGLEGLGAGSGWYGDDELASELSAVALAGPATQVVTGDRHTCALLEGGAVQCWGANEQGQLGYGHTDELKTPGGPLALPGAATQLAAGVAHSCALLEQGEVYCWGSGLLGLKGDGSTGDGLCGGPAEEMMGCRFDPSCCVGDDETLAGATPVVLDGPALQIASGGGHSCALLEGGAVRCWGWNKFGQLGYGVAETVGDDEPPTSLEAVALGGPASQICVGWSHSCALLEGGDVRCWGDGRALGLGTTELIGDDELPSAAGLVALGGPAKQLTCGYVHNCALMETGEQRCWGVGADGRLGYGDEETVGDEPGEMPPPPLSL